MQKIFLLIVTLALPAFGGAQALVTDPAIPVPSVLYRSVFADTPAGVETESVDWKKANAEVGQFRNGHADILKWEAAQAALKTGVAPPMPMPIPMHSPAASPVPAKP